MCVIIIHKEMNSEGFTLIELVTAIGLLAVASTMLVLVINPAEILREARDARRVSDLKTMNEALEIYTLAVSRPNLGDCAKCWVQSDPQGQLTVSANCGGRHGGQTAPQVNSTSVNGSGWVPVNLTQISAGSPLVAWPTDPKSKGDFFYAYACNPTNLTYEFTANLESKLYATNEVVPEKSLERDDGGDQSDIYEVGTDRCLNL